MPLPRKESLASTKSYWTWLWSGTAISSTTKQLTSVWGKRALGDPRFTAFGVIVSEGAAEIVVFAEAQGMEILGGAFPPGEGDDGKATAEGPYCPGPRVVEIDGKGPCLVYSGVTEGQTYTLKIARVPTV